MSSFTDILKDAGKATKRERTPRWHVAVAERYAGSAEEQMVEQIERGGGSVSPPHSLRFAEMHTQLAIAKLAIEKDEPR